MVPVSDTPRSNGHLSSPEYSYSSDTPVLNQLSPTTGLGVHTVAPPVAQINLNGTARLNRFGHIGPETAIQAFYYYFYNSHPFCLPEGRLLELFNERQAPLLEYAVQFIGSSYLPEIPTEMYKDALDRQINNGNYPRDAWSVQALLLFSIGLHAHNEVPRAAQVFAAAQALTLELGLHRMQFAMLHGENNLQLEECWRRTWWSMFTVNGMMTAVNPGVQFRLKDIVSDVPLPCENDQYFSGVSIPLPLSHFLGITTPRLRCIPYTRSFIIHVPQSSSQSLSTSPHIPLHRQACTLLTTPSKSPSPIPSKTMTTAPSSPPSPSSAPSPTSSTPSASSAKSSSAHASTPPLNTTPSTWSTATSATGACTFPPQKSISSTTPATSTKSSSKPTWSTAAAQSCCTGLAATWASAASRA